MVNAVHIEQINQTCCRIIMKSNEKSMEEKAQCFPLIKLQKTIK